MTIRSFVVGKLGVESKSTALAALAMSSLVLSGCTVSDPVGAKSSGVSSSADIDTYTRIELSNRESVPRLSEVVELDLSVVRARYQAFDSSDFSVHLFDRRYYDKGDPLLATSPPPEVPAQLSDRDLDGEPDTLLVLLDFEAGEEKYIAVCTPRFSPLLPRPVPMADGGLYCRATVHDDGTVLSAEGEYVKAMSQVVPARHLAGDGLYFLDGAVMESERTAFVLSLDERLALDVIGKRFDGFKLAEAAAMQEDLSSVAGWGGRLAGGASAYGIGSLAVADGEGVRPLGAYNTVQYRLVSSGPVATEIEILLNGVRLGEDSFDVKWNITHHAGSQHLLHRATVSGTGHQLAFAASNPDAGMLSSPSGRSGWMKALSYGPRNVQTDAGGSLGVGVMARGSQCLGFAEDPEVMGVRFDPMLKSFRWVTVAAWSEAPDGPATLEEFRQSFDELTGRLNSPVRTKNIDFPGR